MLQKGFIFAFSKLHELGLDPKISESKMKWINIIKVANKF